MLRALRLVVHLAWGLVLAARLALDRRLAPEPLAQRWHRGLLGILRLRLRVEGLPLREAHLTVANHVSWLDIPVLGAIEATRFVGKAEIRDWPVAGRLASAAGTFYLRRGNARSEPLVERLAAHLRARGRAVVFPEGTTTDGTEVRAFHPRLLQAAIDAQCPVQPVTLQYALSDAGDSVAPFIGDDSLVAHLARLLRCRELQVRVAYGPPLHPTVSRDELAREAECVVRAALQPPAGAGRRAAPAAGLSPAATA